MFAGAGLGLLLATILLAGAAMWWWESASLVYYMFLGSDGGVLLGGGCEHVKCLPGVSLVGPSPKALAEVSSQSVLPQRAATLLHQVCVAERALIYGCVKWCGCMFHLWMCHKVWMYTRTHAHKLTESCNSCLSVREVSLPDW